MPAGRITCETCKVDSTMLDIHFTNDGRMLCDGCYFAEQPWHNAEPEEGGTDGELC